MRHLLEQIAKQQGMYAGPFEAQAESLRALEAQDQLDEYQWMQRNILTVIQSERTILSDLETLIQKLLLK